MCSIAVGKEGGYGGSGHPGVVAHPVGNLLGQIDNRSALHRYLHSAVENRIPGTLIASRDINRNKVGFVPRFTIRSGIFWTDGAGDYESAGDKRRWTVLTARRANEPTVTVRRSPFIYIKS